jgi:2-polyprenyl-6-methoxyphenol hydroxylase-like FAD-dependent oxidoreductase
MNGLRIATIAAQEGGAGVTAEALASDVIVVGGGVGGCSLAAALAGAGLRVTVLERELEYRDVVRGEGLVHWGYEQAAAMGCAAAIDATPGFSPMTRLVSYDESVPPEVAERHARDLGNMLPDIPGMIGVGHPELREALCSAALKSGATVRFGVSHVEVTPGDAPSVRYHVDDHEHVETARLVVVADGKNSTVRTALGIALEVTKPRIMLTGLLVDDGGQWDRDLTVIGVEGHTLYYVIPRGLDRVRLYIGRPMDDPGRFSGTDREARFLEAFQLESLPNAEFLHQATVVGPCASFPMTDSWLESPVIDGGALIGDAAGWSNPVTGQGLAVALRDARVLSDAMLEADEWTPDTLHAYVEERDERMRRLRFTSALTDLLTAFNSPDRAARRGRMGALMRAQPHLGAAIAAAHVGPWRLPAAAFSPDILTTLALA